MQKKKERRKIIIERNKLMRYCYFRPLILHHREGTVRGIFSTWSSYWRWTNIHMLISLLDMVRFHVFSLILFICQLKLWRIESQTDPRVLDSSPMHLKMKRRRPCKKWMARYVHIIAVSVFDVYYYVHYRSIMYIEWCSLLMDELSLWTMLSLKLMVAVCQ